MRVTCEFDTSAPEDLELLKKMFAEPVTAVSTIQSGEWPPPEAVPELKEEPKPKKRAARKPKAAPEPEVVAEESPVKAAPEPEPEVAEAAPEPEPEVAEAAPEPEVVEAEVVEESAPEATMEAAVAVATKLVGSGEHKKVRAALDAVGTARVSELKESDIPAFMDALAG